MAELMAFRRSTDRTILIQRSIADYDQTNAVELLSAIYGFIQQNPRFVSEILNVLAGR